MRISRLNSVASPPAVYASRQYVAARHATLAPGWRTAPLPGRCRTCWLAVQGFNSSHPPCQGLPWRNISPKKIVSDARRIRNPLFASQAFFWLSEQGGLEVASLVIGGLIALGAMQMMFFYRAAAQQFVFAYWVWDDLVIQAINVAPIVLILLMVVELVFRVLRWIGEKTGLLWPVLAVLHHPRRFAFFFFLVLMICASVWGHILGDAVWNDFKKTGGMESATMLDQTSLGGVHLVGTTSRAAVFLRAKTAGTEEGNTAKRRAKSITDCAPGYFEVAKDVVCALPFPRCPDETLPKSTYRVYVIDRDKIVCHAAEGQCEEIPRKPMVTKQGRS